MQENNLYWILLLPFIAYIFFLMWCAKGFFKKEIIEKEGNQFLSVIVAVRNEERNIQALLDCLLQQSITTLLFEIIIVDDHSSDKTVDIINRWKNEHRNVRLKLLHSDGEGKKAALSKGINAAESEFAVVTDADCLPGKEWLKVIQQNIDTHTHFIAGPVSIEFTRSQSAWENLLTSMQSLEMLGLTAIGGGSIKNHSPMFCNGANMAFRISSFEKIYGFNFSRSVSGDDTQLLKKYHEQFPDGVKYLNQSGSIVFTIAEKTISNFISQRKRWASKVMTTLSGFTISIAVLAFVVHLLLMTLFIIVLATGENETLRTVFLTAYGMKTLSEMFFLSSISKRLNAKAPVAYIPFLQLFYALYIVVTGVISPFGKFNWKGRLVR